MGSTVIPGTPCIDVVTNARVRTLRGAVTAAYWINAGGTKIVFLVRARNHAQDWRRGWWQKHYTHSNWWLEHPRVGAWQP